MNARVLCLRVAVLLAAAASANAEPTIWEPRSQLEMTLDAGAVALSFESLGFSFPFAGCRYEHESTLWLSPRGYVSFDAVDDVEPSASRLATGAFPRVAPLWAGAIATSVTVGRFDEGGPADSEHIAITWRDASGPLAQLQLFSTGAIVFAYEDRTANVAGDRLAGASLGGGPAEPTGVDFSASLPFSTGSQATVYETFAAGAAFDLAGTNLVLEPDGRGGFHVDAVECGRGTVGAGAGAIRDVLFVNGQAGLPVSRRVDASAGTSLVLSLGDASTPNARYVLWAWAVPDFHPAELRAHGERLGCLVNPSPLQPGEPKPIRCLAGLGIPAAASRGVSRIDGPPRAPFAVAAGRRASFPARFVLQGVIEDPHAANTLGFSATNAVLVDAR